MASVNKVIIVGNCRYLQSSDAVTKISVVTSDRYKDKATGEIKENTEWHRITFFGKLAEIANQYLKKGSQVYVEGRLRTSKYTDETGIEKYVTEIIANSMQMLGSKTMDSNNLSSKNAPQKNSNTESSRFDNMDDDISF